MSLVLVIHVFDFSENPDINWLSVPKSNMN
jgi:hypothetical protein